MTLVNTDAVLNAGRLKTKRNGSTRVRLGEWENQGTSAGDEGEEKIPATFENGNLFIPFTLLNFPNFLYTLAFSEESTETV
jgi:hypothetical protein